MDDLFEHLDVLYAEMMAAYAESGDSLAQCQSTGASTDVDRYRADLRRALRLSNSYHLEADLVSAVAASRLGGAA